MRFSSLTRTSLALLISTMVSFRLQAAESSLPLLENIDEVSQKIIAEVIDFENPFFATIEMLWVNPEKRDEAIGTLKGQVIQHKVAAQKEWGTINKNKITLVGSKALPGMIKVVYLIDAEYYPLPFAVMWIKKVDGYAVGGISWGSQVSQDLKDLSQTTKGGVAEFTTHVSE